jgi:benzoate membrane transport protein
MVAAYLLARAWNNPRVPPVGVAVVMGAILVAALGKAGTPEVEGGLPQLAAPGVAFSLEALLTISIPMVVLVVGLGNVQGLGYLNAQGYRTPGNAVTAAVGAMTVVNALFGGHPAAMTRVSSGILGGPSAGPLEKRYIGAIVTMTLATSIALATGLLLAVVAVLPAAYIVTVAGLAILASFEDALGRAFSGPLRAGAAMAFGVTMSTFTVAGIPSAFWALLAGLGVSLFLERGELLKQWQEAIERSAAESRAAVAARAEPASQALAGAR